MREKLQGEFLDEKKDVTIAYVTTCALTLKAFVPTKWRTRFV